MWHPSRFTPSNWKPVIRSYVTVGEQTLQHRGVKCVNKSDTRTWIVLYRHFSEGLLVTYCTVMQYKTAILYFQGQLYHLSTMEAHCYHFVSAYCAPARENERARKRTKVRENEEAKGRENEKTRQRGNEKTKLRNLNPLPLQSIHFVIACISFCFLALFWERTQKWPTVMQDNLIYYI